MSEQDIERRQRLMAQYAQRYTRTSPAAWQPKPQASDWQPRPAAGMQAILRKLDRVIASGDLSTYDATIDECVDLWLGREPRRTASARTEAISFDYLVGK